MIITALMAASLLLSPPQPTRTPARAAIENQAQVITLTLVICRPVLAPNIWDEWLPFSATLGVTPEDVTLMRQIIAERVPFPVTTEVCLLTLANAGEKLQGLMDAEK